jgi:hypothetical protein
MMPSAPNSAAAAQKSKAITKAAMTASPKLFTDNPKLRRPTIQITTADINNETRKLINALIKILLTPHYRSNAMTQSKDRAAHPHDKEHRRQ